MAMTGDTFNRLRIAKPRDKERSEFMLKSPTATQGLPNFGFLECGKMNVLLKIFLFEYFLNSNLIAP